jgi:hypothetical protein
MYPIQSKVSRRLSNEAGESVDLSPRGEGRSAALADMADQAQATGGYDAVATPGPRRQS